ncbi:hypothetical protein [Paraburkholderia caledonica]
MSSALLARLLEVPFDRRAEPLDRPLQFIKQTWDLHDEPRGG